MKRPHCLTEIGRKEKKSRSPDQWHPVMGHDQRMDEDHYHYLRCRFLHSKSQYAAVQTVMTRQLRRRRSAFEGQDVLLVDDGRGTVGYSVAPAEVVGSEWTVILSSIYRIMLANHYPLG